MPPNTFDREVGLVTMISAFGERAKAYALRLGDVDAVICEQTTLDAGYVEAVRRRERAETFYVMLLLDEPRVRFGCAHGNAILEAYPDYDRRRWINDELVLGSLQINSKPASEFWKMDTTVQKILVEFLALGDAMLVRSYTEYTRMANLFATNVLRRQMRSGERILASANVPSPARRRPRRPGVVVWAPRMPAVELALVAHGLFEFQGDLTYVTAGGPLPAWYSGTFCEPGDARVEEALSTASVVLCPDPGDPSDAVAFARHGYGVVAPSTSGAHEFASGLVPWDALDGRTLPTAVAVACTRPACVRSEPARPARAPQRPPRPAFITDLPLISVITPTYNRRERLRKMLSCLAAQTYPNIESIVINDGGEAVDDVVAEFPFARLIDQKINVGAQKACEAGRDQFRGTYVVIIADDDWLYPDHFERIMNAMFRSGAAVAHGAVLLRFLDSDENGKDRTIGYNATTFSETLAPTDSLITSTVANFSMVVKDEVYEKCGWYVADLAVADNEIHIRFCEKYAYAFIDQISSECRDHAKAMSRKFDFPASLRRVFTELHPLPNRPIVESIRSQMVERIALRPAGESPFPMSIRVPETV